MGGPEPEDGRHSTPDDDPRPSLWPRFLFALALIGVLVGMMLGRLTAPDPVHLQRIEVREGGLTLWFDHEPEVRAEALEGAYALMLGADGQNAKGQLTLGTAPVSWKVLRSTHGVMVRFVAARPLHGDWHGAAEDGRWRLEVSLRAE
ncbi:hypothetical protein E8F20_20595 [Pseudomonas sp. BN415]|uniref:hypothetical protein n=1 Tax=Pseudomonadaceae TaxID=135621 RepID=UPI00040A6BEE|nr:MULTISPECIES: hypothetical protein [Pseudomonas]MDE3739097.1 hypothetical protein [Pseudomonas resinovorans]MDH4584265.1 hypothetical protein [Pseudomonas sp. BN415]